MISTATGTNWRSLFSGVVNSRTCQLAKINNLKSAHFAQAGRNVSCRYPRPSVTVDAAIVSRPEAAGQPLQLLLIQRKNPPCKVDAALRLTAIAELPHAWPYSRLQMAADTTACRVDFV